MKSSAITLALTVLMGCATTQVVEVYRDDEPAIARINAKATTEPATVRLFESQVALEARESLSISGDSVRYALRNSGLRATAPLSNVHEIRFGSKESGVGRGVLYGGLIGGVGLGILAIASNEQCSSDSWCLVEFSDSQAFLGGFLVGGLGGALLGGIVGAVSGSPGVVYRFRPDTPQQMSVVVGAGRQSARRNAE